MASTPARWRVILWTRLRGTSRSPAASWKPALVSGAFLITVAQGAVSWSEQYLNSGLAAVLAGTMPIWMLTFNWARPAGQRPNAVMAAGVAIEFAGVMILLAPWQTADRDVNFLGAAAVLLGVKTVAKVLPENDDALPRRPAPGPPPHGRVPHPPSRLHRTSRNEAPSSHFRLRPPWTAVKGHRASHEGALPRRRREVSLGGTRLGSHTSIGRDGEGRGRT
ncbi:MAG: DMT family transporter [Thermoleophilia bacterium]